MGSVPGVAFTGADCRGEPATTGSDTDVAALVSSVGDASRGVLEGSFGASLPVCLRCLDLRRVRLQGVRDRSSLLG